MIHEVQCEDCKSSFTIEMPKFCIQCHPEMKRLHTHLKDIEKSNEELIIKIKEYRRTNKWGEIKRFTYYIILYLPLSIIIGRYFGVDKEMFWVFGGIYFAILPSIVLFLMKVF